MAKKPDTIKPIDASFEDVVGALVPRAGAAPKDGINFKYLGRISGDGAAPLQLRLDLGIQVEKQVDGIEMGVLQNGLPYLTQSGLSRMTGAARATVFEITQEWEQTYGKPIPPKGRMAFFKEYLFKGCLVVQLSCQEVQAVPVEARLAQRSFEGLAYLSVGGDFNPLGELRSTDDSCPMCRMCRSQVVRYVIH